MSFIHPEGSYESWPARPRVADSTTSLPALHVLVVDDEPSVRLVLRDILELEGHAVEVHGNPCEALERVRTGAWDLVMVDRAMPEMDGYALAREIRAFNSHIPILMVSGSQRVGHECEFRTEIDAFVRKPFTIKDLRAGMAQALRIHTIL